MRILGIDYGSSKIGLALGDTESRLALPYKILKNTGADQIFIDIKEICQKERIEKIIFGLPINERQEFSEQMEETKKFGEDLKKEIEMEIIFQDESFSSKMAQKLKPGTKNEDDIAAMLVLQTYLDQISL